MEFDAAVMDGRTMAYGAVLAIRYEIMWLLPLFSLQAEGDLFTIGILRWMALNYRLLSMDIRSTSLNEIRFQECDDRGAQSRREKQKQFCFV